MRARRHSAVVLGVVPLGVLLGVLFGATLLYRADGLRELDERRFLLPSGFPGTEISRRHGSAEVAAVLFHGFQCNRIMMIQLGRFLAHAGLRVFLLDFPGHGESSLPFVQDRIAEQSARAFADLVDVYKISPATTALVGHSFGSIALVKVAAVNPSIFSAVFIGPGYYGGASLESPKNVLILTGEHDHPHILDFASQLFAASTNGAKTTVGGSYGEAPFRRLWKSVPATGHLGLLYNPATFDETLAWIRQDLTLDRAGRLTEGRSFVGLCAAPVITGYLLFVAIVFFGSPRAVSIPSSGTQPAGAQPSGVHPAAILLPFVTTPLAAYWVKSLDPLWSLHILEGSSIVSTLFLSGLLAGTVLVLPGRSGIKSPTGLNRQAGQLLRASVVALVCFGLFYAVTRLTVSNDFYDLTLKFTPRRLAALGVFSLCSAVFFVVVGGMLTRLHGGLDRALARVPVMALTIGAVSLLLPASLNLLAPALRRFFAPMAVVLLFALGLQWMLLERHRDTQGVSIFAGLLVGWVTSVGFLAY